MFRSPIKALMGLFFRPQPAQETSKQVLPVACSVPQKIANATLIKEASSKTRRPGENREQHRARVYSYRDNGDAA